MTFIDVIWWAVGGILAVAGFVFAVRALFWDRSRGRKRCPKCWYDLSGGKSNRCPECGYEAQKERRLYKTRRRWRRAILGVLVIFAGFGAIGGREVYRNGWIKAVPTIAYIILLPGLDLDTTHEELWGRVNRGELHQWEYTLLVNRIIDVLESDTEKDRLLANIILMGTIVYESKIDRKNESKDYVAYKSHLDIDKCLDAIIPFLEHEDTEVQIRSIETIGDFEGDAIPVFPLLVGKMASDVESVQSEAMSILGNLKWQTNNALAYTSINDISSPDSGLFHQNEKEFFIVVRETYGNPQQTTEMLSKGLSHSSHNVRALCVYSLALLAPDRKEVRDSILTLSNDSDFLVRLTVASATSIMPFDDQVKDIISNDLLEEDGYIAIATLSVLRYRANEAAVFEDKILQVIEEGLYTRRDPFFVSKAAGTLVAIGGDPEIAIGALLEIIQRYTNSDQIDALKELSKIDYESFEAIEAIRPLLDSAKAETQAEAALAYAMLGGDSNLATKVIWNGLVNGPKGWEYFTAMLRLANSGLISVPVMIENLKSTQANKRASAARFLGFANHHAADALPELRRLLTDRSPRVVEKAEKAIEQIEEAIEKQKSEDN